MTNNSFKEQEPLYKTRELSLATYFISLGLDFMGIEAISRESFFFVFKEPDRCYKFEKKFFEIKQILLDKMKEHQNGL